MVHTSICQAKKELRTSPFSMNAEQPSVSFPQFQIYQNNLINHIAMSISTFILKVSKIEIIKRSGIGVIGIVGGDTRTDTNLNRNKTG